MPDIQCKTTMFPLQALVTGVEVAKSETSFLKV